MLSFYINTATQETTIALFDNNNLVAEKHWLSKQNEAKTLQPAVDELLKKNNLIADDIDRLIVCVGPGGFTSCRIGISAINAWAFAKNIPVAAVSVFNLYSNEDSYIIVSANSNEAWIKSPAKVPEYVTKDSYPWPENFNFTGIVNEDWKKYFENLAGESLAEKEGLPDISKLAFSKDVVKPWYYKDPNITWSKKIQTTKN